MKQIKKMIILTMTGVMLLGGPALQTKATATTTAEGQAGLSDDNSLSSLSLSEGELTPSLQAGRTKYTAVVPNNVTDVEVTAKTSHAKAQVTSISGNTGLSEGENVISIVVKAENGTEATYKVTVTRESVADGEENGNMEEAGDAEADDIGVVPISEADTAELTEDDVALYSSRETGSVTSEEYDAMQQKYDELNEKYTELKEHNRNIMMGLSGACAVLAVICLVLFFRKRKPDEDDFFEEEEFYEKEEEAYEEEAYEEDDKSYEEEVYEGDDEVYGDDFNEDESGEDNDETYEESYDEEEAYPEEDGYDDTYDEELEEEVEELPRKKTRKPKRKHGRRENLEDEFEVIDLNDL